MRSPPSRPSPARTVAPLGAAAAAAAMGVDPAMLAAPTRKCAPVARARQIAVYLHHVAMGASLSDCARLFGRDRSTMRHACARIEDMRDDPTFDDGLARLAAALVAQRDMLRDLLAAVTSTETRP
jgi:hypothetical protein